ncbi:hypothetical protein [Cysteiniphilum marinum]|uniref:hypothetical protein n=1 Tax=Cysteiniphilum marinum TaxID=2774191 RepID=UPI0019398BD5|nr:hypothetical protein [Cysteiniphilum marinum]
MNKILLSASVAISLFSTAIADNTNTYDSDGNYAIGLENASTVYIDNSYSNMSLKEILTSKYNETNYVSMYLLDARNIITAKYDRETYPDAYGDFGYRIGWQPKDLQAMSKLRLDNGDLDYDRQLTFNQWIAYMKTKVAKSHPSYWVLNLNKDQFINAAVDANNDIQAQQNKPIRTLTHEQQSHLAYQWESYALKKQLRGDADSCPLPWRMGNYWGMKNKCSVRIGYGAYFRYRNGAVRNALGILNAYQTAYTNPRQHISASPFGVTAIRK